MEEDVYFALMEGVSSVLLPAQCSLDFAFRRDDNSKLKHSCLRVVKI